MTPYIAKIVTGRVLGALLLATGANAGFDLGYFGKFDNIVACAVVFVCLAFYSFFRPTKRDRELHEKHRRRASGKGAD